MRAILPGFRRSLLAGELGFVFALKLLLLLALWIAFFRVPPAPTPTAAGVSRFLLGETATGASLHRGPADVQDAQMPRRPGMDESGLGPIGESATGASLHRGPRLDPIGDVGDGPAAR